MPSPWHDAALTPSDKLLLGPPTALLCPGFNLRAVPLLDIPYVVILTMVQEPNNLKLHLQLLSASYF